jgi:endonuclease/exonuclease/phosphatase family metal-dependent hydrolase
MKDPDGKRLIDHVALSESLHGEVTEIISRKAEDGTRLSDHSGVVVNIGE